jgi:uncharacterized membrane protein YhaH (DUF805 family)
MTFGSAISTCFSKYATFNGRASKSEFWWWMLFVVMVHIAAAIITSAISPETGSMLTGLLSLGLFLPGLAVQVRRLHDTGHSGWWILLVLVPLIGFIVLLVWWLGASTPIANQYGEPPVAN